LNKIKAQLLEKLSDFKQKELPENALALFIDAYHTEVKDRGKVKKSCVYVVLGLDLDGHKDVYGFYTLFPKVRPSALLCSFKEECSEEYGKRG